METESQIRKTKPSKYTNELVLEILNYIHEKTESDSFSLQEMYDKYSTTSANFFSILKKEHVLVKSMSQFIWIGDIPSSEMAHSVREKYLEQHRISNQNHKQKKQKLEQYKKNQKSINEAEKALKSEELELESSALYKKLVNEKDYNAIIDESGSKSIDSMIDALATKASDALVKAEEMYKEALLEIENLKVKNHRITMKNEELKKESCFWKGEYELLACAEPVSKEISEGSLPYPKKYIKILGIKFYVKQ